MGLLLSHKVVLFLSLREPKVQKIRSPEEMIKCLLPNHLVQSVVSHLHDTEGADITVIVDRFDELNYNLHGESFFRELIEGDLLPAAQVVATSRPYVSACLHQYVERRIEILGFEKSSKEQYIKDVLHIVILLNYKC